MSSAEMSPAADVIRVRGARVHNLRGIDVDIPRDRLVVITGPSGSGKSSLAFDTIFAEGQRQYIESLSAYARQFLDQMERPDADLIDGLQPTIAIDQQAGGRNPRSTVATVTEIYDYLRLLMARVGVPHCYECGAEIRQQTPEQILEQIQQLPIGTKAMLLAPLVRGRKGRHEDTLAAIRQAGFVRARVDGQVVDVDPPPDLAPRKPHTIEAVVDRIVVREGLSDRIAESLRLAITHGQGAVIVSRLLPGKDPAAADAWEDRLLSTVYACPNCKISLEEIAPRTFSFNSPYGACPACEGLGVKSQFDPELLIPDESLSLAAGAIAPWRGAAAALMKRRREELEGFLTKQQLGRETPLADFSAEQRGKLLYGDGDFLGVVTLLEKELATATKAKDRQRLEGYRARIPCLECGGARLKPAGRSVRLQGQAIHEIAALDARQATAFFSGLQFGPQEAPTAGPLVADVLKRLDFLLRVGLDYLTLDRSADSLSGGELQRVRLASAIGSGLVGVCYVLDEPSIGLHPRDNDRLIAALRQLQQQGATVLVVEHDAATMRAADWLIDMGPGAGVHGGQIVAQGEPQAVAAEPTSLTGRYLAGAERIALPAERRQTTKGRSLVLEGATLHNLKDLTVRFPLAALVCVTGVSGSGKSSLLNETLAPALRRRLTGEGPKPGPFTGLRGVNLIDKLIEVDQSPIGRTGRSSPATYTGLFDEIRKVFASTREAKQRGFRAGRFSFNVAGGRCEECRGHGLRKIEMNFLPDLVVKCPVCEGRRFNQQTLQVRYREKSIADVLDMPVEEALEFFQNFPAIVRLLTRLQEVGLGYVTLGQPATTLSGGEAQRVKLAAELARVDTGQTLYLLDEPTTGLHFDDVRKLLEVLQRLVDLGNTVIVVEHNLDVIKLADWVIDLGPEGGQGGGEIVAEGSPEDVAAIEKSHTGAHLGAVLAPR